MSSTSAVSYARAAASQTSSAEPSTGFQAADFMTLLIAQLQNQDPLEPLGPAEFMAQLAQLQSVTQLSALNDTLTSLAQNQAIAGAASVIGRTVTWSDGSGSHEGVVTGLSRVGATLQPVVGERAIPWSSISAVQ